MCYGPPMGSRARKALEEALHLPADERATLAAAVLDSLDGPADVSAHEAPMGRMRISLAWIACALIWAGCGAENPNADMLTMPALGAPCLADVDCGADLRCDIYVPGGMCTRDCAADDDCGEGGRCAAGQCYLACRTSEGCRRASPWYCSITLEFDLVCVAQHGTCATASDCHAGACVGRNCEHCQNGIKDGAEGDVDCGGPDCKSCGEGSTCATPNDCTSMGCVAGRCSHCGNKVKDFDEVNIDCGGTDCPKCARGMQCQSAADCAEGCCAATCLASTCCDAKRNASETDIDCGGPDCPSCPEGKLCTAKGDCLLKDCYEGRCDHCHDGVMDGDESDIDCGGATCRKRCSEHQGCSHGTDCDTAVCGSPHGGLTSCLPASCGNQKLDGGETDIDCGGPDCPLCDLRKRCKAAGDCAAPEYPLQAPGACVNGICGCPAGYGPWTSKECSCDPNTCKRCCDGQSCGPADAANPFELTCDPGPGTACVPCSNNGTCTPDGVCTFSCMLGCPGCCAGDACVDWDDDRYCGPQGKVCAPCPKGTHCLNGACVTPPDGGATDGAISDAGPRG